MSEHEYDGPELFEPIDWAAFAVGLDFNEGIISSVTARYDLRTRRSAWSLHRDSELEADKAGNQ